MIYYRRKNGFTLVEMMVAMALLGILILFAAPGAKGYISKSKISQIRNDTGVTDVSIDQYLLYNKSLPSDWSNLSLEEMNEYLSDGKVYSSWGKIESLSGEYQIIPEEYIKKNVKSQLNGIFITNNEGETYYIHTQ